MPKYTTLESKYKSVAKPILQKDEKSIEIQEIYVYPIKGIRAYPVKKAWLGAHGMKYDRELVLIDLETGKHVNTGNYKPACNLM